MSNLDLTTLEQHVLSAAQRLHPNAYGVTIRDDIEQRTGQSRSIGSIYSVLDRLETRGFLESRLGEATPERGGKRKLYFTITARGQLAAERSYSALRSMRRGLAVKGARV